MKIEIKGDPGTGNHYTEVNIENIENNFPNVTAVNIIKDADGQKTIVETDRNHCGNNETPPTVHRDKEAQRQDILQYVGKTLQLVRYDWKDKYMALWEDILDLPDVNAFVYQKGRQQNTSFNRKLVLHIICYLGKDADGGIGIFERNYVATNVAMLLDDGCEKSTRPELGFKPEKSIQMAIDELMETQKYQSK